MFCEDGEGEIYDDMMLQIRDYEMMSFLFTCIT